MYSMNQSKEDTLQQLDRAQQHNTFVQEKDTGIDQEDQETLKVASQDMLVSRRLPTSDEAAPIEEEDIRHAIAQSETHIFPFSDRLSDGYAARSQSVSDQKESTFKPVMATQTNWRWQGFTHNYLRNARQRRAALILLVVLTSALLLVSSMIALFAPGNHAEQTQAVSAHPTLSVTPTMAHTGQVVSLHLDHFSTSGHIFLTRDIQQKVRTDAGSALFPTDALGNADVHVLVQDGWGSGLHLLVAEDTRTHFAASVDLTVTGDISAPPPHLLVSSPDEPKGLKGMVNLGTGVQGINTIQALLLSNTGGGWISWNATSDEPWLQVAPRQGIFQANEGFFIAAARAHLKPGQYNGTVTLTSNTGAPVILRVTMTTLPLPRLTKSLLEVESPLLSFTATDGAQDPAYQSLTISNAGAQVLRWSVSVSIYQNLFNQDVSGEENPSWLQPGTVSGVIATGASEPLQVAAHTQRLLPGVYIGLLVFSNGSEFTQPVVVVLTVQQRCGVATSQGEITFSLFAGQRGSQLISVSMTPGCTDVTNWMGFSPTGWLKLAPALGQLEPGMSTLVMLQVDASTLAPGTYNTWMYFLTEMRSQMLAIRVTVLSPTTTPIGNQQGSFPPQGTAVLSNTPPAGTTNTPAPGVTPSPAPTGPTGPTGTATPVPGPGMPTPTGTPAPQTCALQVTPANLAFAATPLQPNPPGQSLMLNTSGQCSQSVIWQASVDAASQNWLHLSATSGTIGKHGSSLVVQVNTSGMLLGTYTGQIRLTANASGASLQGSPQSVAVTLTVIL